MSLGGLFQPAYEGFISAWMTSCVPRKLMRMIMTVISGIPRCPSDRSHRRNSKALFCPWYRAVAPTQFQSSVSWSGVAE